MYFFEGMKTLIEKFYLAIKGIEEMPIPMSEAIRATAIIDEIFKK